MPLRTILTPQAYNRCLLVQLAIQNDKPDYAVFGQWACSWQWDWVCDDKQMELRGDACTANTTSNRILKPGERVTMKPCLVLISGTTPRRTTFRFGLRQRAHNLSDAELRKDYPRLKRDVRLNVFRGETMQKEDKIFWTNPVTLTLRPEWVIG